VGIRLGTMRKTCIQQTMVWNVPPFAHKDDMLILSSVLLANPENKGSVIFLA
jgi:hypothetical protein